MALDALDKATVGGWGGDRKSEEIKLNNVNLDSGTEAPVGNSNAYALRKLRKDRPDLHKQVLAGDSAGYPVRGVATWPRCETQSGIQQLFDKARERLIRPVGA